MEENSSRKFLLIFTIVSCFSLSCGNPEPKEIATAGEEDSNRVAVETHVVLAGEVADVVKATGTIFPKHDVLISSETAGAIQKVYIELGDWVQKGAPLVQVDPEMKHLALEQATARAAQARAAYEKSQRDFERNEKLLKSQDISEFVFENVRLQKESAEAAYLMAEADVKMARRQLKDTRIVSPVAGFVAHLIAEPGQTVAPGTPIAKVVDISEVKVKFGVPEKDIVKLRKGQEVTISVDSYSGSKFQGTVTAVGPQADLSSRAFPVEVTSANPLSQLKAGMIAAVEVTTSAIQNLPLLPKSALLERSGQTLVFVVENGKAVQRTPRFGLESGEFTSVLEGLKAGEKVVVLGQENLTQGTAVEVK